MMLKRPHDADRHNRNFELLRYPECSILKFIEHNWGLPTISNRSRDNFPNPKVAKDNPYVPENTPAIGDLFDLFDFGRGGGHN